MNYATALLPGRQAEATGLSRALTPAERSGEPPADMVTLRRHNKHHPFGTEGRSLIPPIVICPHCKQPFGVEGDTYTCPCGRGFRITYTATQRNAPGRPLPFWGRP